MATVTRVYLTHAPEDASFAERVAADLRAAGARVWPDDMNTTPTPPPDADAPNIPAIEASDALVLLLSPAAAGSSRIVAEVAASIGRYKRDLMQAPVIVQVAPTREASIPPLWTAYRWIEATGDESVALAETLKVLSLTPPPAHTDNSHSETPAPTNAEPQPWTPYPEVPALSASASLPSTPIGLTRPSQPLLQQTATPSTPLPWTPYPGASHLATATQEAPAHPRRSTKRLFGRPQLEWSRLWTLAQVMSVLVPLGVFVALVFATQSELVDGLRGLAIASVSVAVVAAITLAFALALKRDRRIRVSWWAAIPLMALLVTGVAGGFTFPSRVHSAEAHFFEGRHQWWPAIAQYELAGEQETMGSPDIVRVHDEWGEALLKQRDYAGAVNQFNQADEETLSATTAYDNRAQSDLFHAYVVWIQTGGSNVSYLDAITFLYSYRYSSLCHASCQGTASQAEAQARYQYGLQLYQTDDIQAAVYQFQQLQTEYPTSPLAPQAHSAAARALNSQAQQQFAMSCDSAVPTYDELATHYSDTPEGAKAKAALAAPVQVTGQFIKLPANAAPTAYLSKNAHAPMTLNTSPGSYYFSADYSTAVDPQSGAYTFNNIPQGDYTISTYWAGSTEWWGNTSTNQLYFFHVGPLCPFMVAPLDASHL